MSISTAPLRHRFPEDIRIKMKQEMKELHDKFYMGQLTTDEPKLSFTTKQSGKRKNKYNRPEGEVAPKVVEVLNTPTVETTEVPTVPTVEKPKVEKKLVVHREAGAPSKLVTSLIGTTENGVQVISYNAEMSLPGKPAVNVHCTKCNTDITCNAYHVKYHRKLKCGCNK